MVEPHLDAITLLFAAAIAFLPWIALDLAERREPRAHIAETPDDDPRKK